jgi:potassium inwardly-rectifying channel subfamily J
VQDFFTTLVDIKWRWTLLAFASAFIVTWISIACIWYSIAYSHGDIQYYENIKLEEELLKNNETYVLSKYNPCVTEIFNFYSAFLFSLETQNTIG